VNSKAKRKHTTYRYGPRLAPRAAGRGNVEGLLELETTALGMAPQWCHFRSAAARCLASSSRDAPLGSALVRLAEQLAAAALSPCREEGLGAHTSRGDSSDAQLRLMMRIDRGSQSGVGHGAQRDLHQHEAPQGAVRTVAEDDGDDEEQLAVCDLQLECSGTRNKNFDDSRNTRMQGKRGLVCATAHPRLPRPAWNSPRLQQAAASVGDPQH